MEPVRIFTSYSQNDRRWIDDPRYGLIMWLRNTFEGLGTPVEMWVDRELRKFSGEDYSRKIRAEIAGADIVILLVSTDFITSKFIAENELPLIRERHHAGDVVVIPILARPLVSYKSDRIRWITDLQMLPGAPTPLLEIIQDEAAWERTKNEIAEAISFRIDEVQQKRSGAAAAASQILLPVDNAPSEAPSIVRTVDSTRSADVSHQSPPEPRVGDAAPLELADIQPAGHDERNTKAQVNQDTAVTDDLPVRRPVDIPTKSAAGKQPSAWPGLVVLAFFLVMVIFVVRGVFLAVEDRVYIAMSDNNLKKIGVACDQYRRYHNNQPPPIDSMADFQNAISSYLGEDAAKVYVEPGTNQTYNLSTELPIYGSALDSAMFDLDIVLREPVAHGDGKIEVLYGDGTVRSVMPGTP